MRKIDIIYNNFINLLRNLTTESVVFDDFYGSLTEGQQSALIDIADKIASEKRNIERSFVDAEFYSDFTNLIYYLNDFYSRFGNYPNLKMHELLSIISVIQKLTIEFGGVTPLNLEEVIAPGDFALIELQDNINQENFLYYDASDITQSIFLFNIYDTTAFKDYVNSLTTGAQILYFLLSKLGTAVPLSDSKYVLVKTEFSAKPKIVKATLCLHIIISGKIIHRDYEYSFPPKIPISNFVVLGKNYQQFSDSIGIISEYIHQKDILDKYLRIYHVFENFMYKSPLVKLERGALGTVFSIRDFQRMYDRISDSEINMLKKLFDNILTLEHIPGETFNTRILNNWAGLIPVPFPDSVNIDILISLLNIKTNKGNDIFFANIDPNSLPHFLAKLIYAFRNSLVHNRETEFHLTHHTLLNHPVIGNTCLIVLEKFLIPILEELAFYLIINENQVVWYDKSSLKLWEEN